MNIQNWQMIQYWFNLTLLKVYKIHFLDLIFRAFYGLLPLNYTPPLPALPPTVNRFRNRSICPWMYKILYMSLVRLSLQIHIHPYLFLCLDGSVLSGLQKGWAHLSCLSVSRSLQQGYLLWILLPIFLVVKHLTTPVF